MYFNSLSPTFSCLFCLHCMWENELTFVAEQKTWIWVSSSIWELLLLCHLGMCANTWRPVVYPSVLFFPKFLDLLAINSDLPCMWFAQFYCPYIGITLHRISLFCFCYCEENHWVLQDIKAWLQTLEILSHLSDFWDFSMYLLWYKLELCFCTKCMFWFLGSWRPYLATHSMLFLLSYRHSAMNIFDTHYFKNLPT